MNAKFGILAAGAALFVSAANLVITFMEHRNLDKKAKENEEKVTKLVSTIGKAVNDLADATPVQVKDAMVEEATNKAVNREVGKAVENAVSNVRNDIREEVSTQVRAEIKSAKDNTIDEVDRKLREEVEKISRDDIISDVRRKITGTIIERLNDDLDEIREQYNKKMGDNVDELTRKARSRMNDILDDTATSINMYKLLKV